MVDESAAGRFYPFPVDKLICKGIGYSGYKEPDPDKEESSRGDQGKQKSLPDSAPDYYEYQDICAHQKDYASGKAAAESDIGFVADIIILGDCRAYSHQADYRTHHIAE